MPRETYEEYHARQNARIAAGLRRSPGRPPKRPEPGLEIKKRYSNGPIANAPKKPRSSLTKQYLADMHADWTEHGSAVIAHVRENDPVTYLKVVTQLIPKNVNITDDTDGKSVGQLRAEVLVELGRALERGDAQLIEHLESLQQGGGSKPVIEVQAVQETDGVPRERGEGS